MTQPAVCPFDLTCPSRISLVEKNLGSPPNDATGDPGEGLYRVVADLARAQRRNVWIVGILAGVLSSVLVEVVATTGRIVVSVVGARPAAAAQVSK